MFLKSFHVTKFQSVLDSREVKTGEITCLVGKNEAGKSAVLKALYKLNPIRKEDANFNHVDDYPRLTVTDYEEGIKAGKPAAQVIKATFTLDPAEVSEAKKVFGDASLPSDEVVVSKGYDNKQNITWNFDDAAARDHLIKGLPAELKEAASKTTVPKEILALLKDSAAEPAVAAITPILSKCGDKAFGHYVWAEMIEELPKFLYFDEYYQMTGAENIEALMQRESNKQLRPSDEPLLGLIALAGLNLQQMLNPERTRELKNRLEGAGNKLTAAILKYWSQNKHLQMRFDVRPGRPQDPEHMRGGTNIWGEVYDTKHFVSTELGTRSRGFVWFFSFVAWYSEIRRKGEKVILLLDEPGLTLHGRAQGDLLNYFETELMPHHQVIYSTHSPFMVDPRHFERVRIVQDLSIDKDDLPEGQQGTKVTEDIFEATDDSLFPLQGALGYEVHQSLFIGPNSLLVEGVSDLFYLKAVSSILEKEGKTGLSEKWVITPCGGASKVPTIVRLMTGQKGLKFATLIDIQDSDKLMIESLYKQKLMKKANVLTFADFTKTAEADIEDMFESDFYLGLVNEEYKDVLAAPLKQTDFENKNPRILARIESHLKKIPLKKGEFSHYRVARYFQENLATLEKSISKKTKDRFEAAFRAVNDLL